MSKRTLRNGTIVHKREGAPVPFVPQIQTNPGVDTLELLRPERAVERLEAENAALTRQRDLAADEAHLYAAEAESLIAANAALTREVEGLRTALKPYAEMEQSVLWDDHGDAVDVWDAPGAQIAIDALAATTDTKETTDGNAG